jgi:hypothetical protein
LTFVDGLYGELLQRGIRYFLPDSYWSTLGPAKTEVAELALEQQDERRIELEWLGTRFCLSRRGRAFTAAEVRMVKAIGNVLAARYQLLFNAPLAAQSYQLFRGFPEDRYVSAFLDPAPYRSAEDLVRTPDRVDEAIEVLRISSSSTYENRRIETGVLLFGSQRDPCHPLPRKPEGSLRYANELTGIRSFHQLCDGLQTVALVDRDGLMVEIVDVQEWARPFRDYPLAVPSARVFEAHSRATLCGGHICLVLTPNGEIKVFAEGVEVFQFLDGRWRLTDSSEKYALWESAIGDAKFAERLFQVALDLAEERRGGLFVVLRDAETVGKLLLRSDLLHNLEAALPATKRALHYLLRGTRVLDLPSSVLETVARIDGAIVMDRESNLLSFGAILLSKSDESVAVEGGRTTAAIHASQYADVLKVSEDGLISFYRDRECIWEL